MKEFFIRLTHDVFVISLVTFIVYFFADVIKPGLVTNYINLNMLLLFVIASGIGAVLTPLEARCPKVPVALPSAGRPLTGLTSSEHELQ